MISAKVICDSVSPAGKRLTTFEVTAHRFILAEINTHRVLSRNYRSSRAVPSEKLIEEVRTNPAMPVFWGKNQSGMQAAEELTGAELEAAQKVWRLTALTVAQDAEALARTGLHKQIANRVLEPFLWVHGVITATEWDNFFGLRLHKDAQPEFRALARAMWGAREASTPRELKMGQWHLPYIEGYAPFVAPGHDIIKRSVARCARVSYKPFDADRPSTLEEDLRLYDRLLGAQPVHASPAEHQAVPDKGSDVLSADEKRGIWTQWGYPEQHGNFVGWRQYRKMIEGESCAPMPSGE